MDDDEMVSLLAEGLIEAIPRVAPQVHRPVRSLSFELYPWLSYLALSIADATTPGDERNSAEWRLFEAARSDDVGSGAVVVETWHRVVASMSDAYDDVVRRDVMLAASLAARYHELAAAALRSSPVQRAVLAAGWGSPELQVINVDDPDRRNFAAD